MLKQLLSQDFFIIHSIINELLLIWNIWLRDFYFKLGSTTYTSIDMCSQPLLEFLSLSLPDYGFIFFMDISVWDRTWIYSPTIYSARTAHAMASKSS